MKTKWIAGLIGLIVMAACKKEPCPCTDPVATTAAARSCSAIPAVSAAYDAAKKEFTVAIPVFGTGFRVAGTPYLYVNNKELKGIAVRYEHIGEADCEDENQRITAIAKTFPMTGDFTIGNQVRVMALLEENPGEFENSNAFKAYFKDYVETLATKPSPTDYCHQQQVIGMLNQRPNTPYTINILCEKHGIKQPRFSKKTDGILTVQ